MQLLVRDLIQGADNKGAMPLHFKRLYYSFQSRRRDLKVAK